MSSIVYDALVVGSGPAGSSAAFDLATAGARVLVLERLPLPRAKTCGGGLVGRTLAWLPAGLELQPERVLRAVELNLLDQRLRYVVRRPSPVVTMTMRADFDLALLRAAEGVGAESRSGCEVVDLREERDAVAVSTCGETYRARFVIGADGINGRVARLAGWRRSPHGIPALECEMDVAPSTLERFAETARFDVGRPDDGYAWVFPKREHLSVGLLRMRRGARGLKHELARYAGSCGLSFRDDSRVCGWQIPVRPRPGGLSRGRVLLAGDAAGLADPVTAEGISFAVLSGRLAAAAVLCERPDGARSEYRRRLARQVLPELRAGRVLAWLLYRGGGLRELVFRRYGQPICEVLTDVFLGRRSYRGLLRNPANYVKLLLRARAS